MNTQSNNSYFIQDEDDIDFTTEGDGGS